MDEPKPKDRWDKFAAITNFLAVIVLGVIGLLVNTSLKERDANVKMVEVAVGVLRAKPDEASLPLRNWVITVVNSFSGIPLPREAVDVLRTNVLPSVRFLTDEGGNVLTDSQGNPLSTK